jgi:hypothetical protein
MAIKSIELDLANRGMGCLGKAYSDEPVFILRAQDRFAPDVVEVWAAKVEAVGKVGNGDKIKEARALAHQMRAWQALHVSKVPD